MIPVELTPQVVATSREMRDRGEQPPRCHDGVIRSAIAGAVRRLVDGDADDVGVRPETTRRVALQGSGPDAVLAARHGYRWTDGDGGVLLTSRGDSALIIEG